MFQRFFTNTIETKFIKSMLSSIPLPLYNTVSDGDYLIKGCMYCYNNNIIRCTRSGLIRIEKQQGLLCSPDVICSTSLLVSEHGAIRLPAKYEIVRSYTLGESLPMVTRNYINKYNYYEGTTHRYLGDYLRCYRDITGVDLMPFYNCYNYEHTDTFHFEGRKIVEGSNDFYSVYLIPIRFNRTYTIAIDCSTAITFSAVFCGKFGLLPSVGNTSEKYLTAEIGDGIHNIAIPRFNEPFTYRVETAEKEIYEHEKYLYLAMQVPSTNNSSIAVLEGDYTNLMKKELNAEQLNFITTKKLNSAMLSNLSLLRVNDGNIYAFSDRIIEYMLLNVIDSDEEISKNILRTQEKLGLDNRGDTTNGVWDRKMRYFMYRTYIKDRFTDPIDINGFVDRDMEHFISGGVEYGG